MTERMRRVITRGKAMFESIFFIANTSWWTRVFQGILLAGIFVFGVYLWGFFYSWGNISLDFLDWAEVTGPRYALLKDAVTRGELPLFAANTTALRGVTDRYFAIPDTPFSPQIILLRWISITRYLFWDTMLFYFIGFIGLVWLARRFHLAPLAFFILFLLFNFNGYITIHLAVGHSVWTAYFLLPYYLVLIFDLLERQNVTWRWLLGFAILMAVMLMQGGFHQYLWCLLFLAVLALVNMRLWKSVAKAGVVAVLVGLPRLLPPALVIDSFSRQNEYLGGFATVMDLFQHMVVLNDPDRAMAGLRSITFPLNAWEQDFFIGLLGLAFLVGFGIVWRLWQDRSRVAVHVQLLVACTLFAALSIGQVYQALLKVLRFPPFTGERVTARLFIIPLVVVMLLAVISFQRFMDRRQIGTGVQLLFLGGTGLLFHDLNRHLQTWRIRYLDGLVNYFPKVPFAEAQHTLKTQVDPLYTGLLLGGAVVALLTLFVLIFMERRERRQRKYVA